MKLPQSGLYAITQCKDKTDPEIIAAVTAAVQGGAAIVQYRHKQASDNDALATALLLCCHELGVALLINDNIALAKRIGADGVHLGKMDASIGQARKLLGDRAIIGVSCYNSVEFALDAQKRKVDYVAFGRFFNSGSKPLAAAADLATLRLAQSQIQLPIVAIGGILPENGRQLIDAGADMLAVIGGLFDHEPKSLARAYCALFVKKYCPSRE